MNIKEFGFARGEGVGGWEKEGGEVVETIVPDNSSAVIIRNGGAVGVHDEIGPTSGGVHVIEFGS